ncbi:MAG: diphthine synthase, partial [Nanoarchaeota archaeon]|nr:diphthine synthase [Nanoarchaeota archaeon]
MTLYMIGIGLSSPEDITYKGLQAVEKADFVYLENYTSMLQCKVSDLETFYNKKILLADRNFVEKKADEILEKAIHKNVAFLVVGDVFGATTHTDLYLRAINKGLGVSVINNASIINAVGIVGLELYKFGKTTSLPYPEQSFKPQTAYDAIKTNQQANLHTLILLDIKPDRKMTVNEAINILLDIEEERKEKVFTKNKMIIGCARIGGNFNIKYGRASDLKKEDFGNPLHCLIVPGKLHFIEEEMLELWTIKKKVIKIKNNH